MKKNLLMALTVAALAVGTCSIGTAAATTTAEAAASAQDNHRGGERGDMAKVTAVSSDSITVAKAERPENGGQPQGDEKQPSQPQGGENMTPPAQGNDNTAPSEKPQGNENMTPPEQPQGNESMTPPEQPQGDESMTPPEQPQGDDNMTPPEKPEGDESTTPPEKPEGEDNTESSEKPEMTLTETTVDLSDVTIYKMGENHEKTECTYSDISVGDMVSLVYGSDGTTVTEIVVNTKPTEQKELSKAPADSTASGSAVEIGGGQHKDRKGDMAKVTAVTADTLTVVKAEKPDKSDKTEAESTDKKTKPEITYSDTETTIDLSNVTIYKKGENKEKTEGSYSDISEGDVVSIRYDADGTTVKDIVVKE